jgi:predicted small lipoprotein YifL
MLNTSRRTAVLAVVIAALAACGCSGPSTTGPSAVPTGTSTMVVLNQNFDDVEPGGQRIVDFTVPHRGALVVTVGWNDPANSVVAVLTGTGCRNLRNPDGDCSVQRSVERGGKAGEQFIDSPDAAGAYQLLLENEGPGLESIRVNAELTSEFAAPTPPTPVPTQPPAHNPAPTPRQSGYPR